MDYQIVRSIFQFSSQLQGLQVQNWNRDEHSTWISCYQQSFQVSSREFGNLQLKHLSSQGLWLEKLYDLNWKPGIGWVNKVLQEQIRNKGKFTLFALFSLWFSSLSRTGTFGSLTWSLISHVMISSAGKNELHWHCHSHLWCQKVNRDTTKFILSVNTLLIAKTNLVSRE